MTPDVSSITRHGRRAGRPAGGSARRRVDGAVRGALRKADDHIVYVMSYCTRLDHLPTGAMYTFLKDAGARAGLDRLIQIGTQLGTGRISSGTYVLAATLDTGDGSGIETATTDYGTTITTVLTLQPFEVDGKAMYTPIAFG
jgi:hypothetical protein